MTKKIPKPSQQEMKSKPEEYLAYNMDILKGMIDRCDYLYAQKTADISRGLERNFIEGHQHYNNDIEKLVTKFGEECHCNKRHPANK